MKTIKINFCGFWSSFKPQNNIFINILSRYFNVEISDKPDLLICSNRGLPFEYMKYNCPRLMFMGENMSPDWTVFDYCIGFDFMDFGDRYFRLPLAFYNDDALPWRPEILTADQAASILRGKKYFCNFVYGHPSSHGMLGRLRLVSRLGGQRLIYRKLRTLSKNLRYLTDSSLSTILCTHILK